MLVTDWHGMLPLGHTLTGLLSRCSRSTYHWSEVRLPHHQDRWPIPSFQGVSLSDGSAQLASVRHTDARRATAGIRPIILPGAIPGRLPPYCASTLTRGIRSFSAWESWGSRPALYDVAAS